jgi:NAD(P)-dependent dehydrogenase (short-subunit alcohol dehydrogenase family)
MTVDFSGKIVLVTGGGNGIGAASSRGFAKGGARVAVIDRDGAAANSVAAEIGGGATGHALDVADGAAFARLASEIAAQAGGIDILVNSAGTITRQTIAAMPVADWDRVIAVNLRGPFNGVQAVIPHMKARGGGAVVNIASVAGRRISFGGGANYSASKAGLLGFTRHAAYELAPDRIRVNAVCPGPTATGFGGGQLPSEEQKGAPREEDPARPHGRARGHRRRRLVPRRRRRPDDHRRRPRRGRRRVDQQRHPLRGILRPGGVALRRN